MSEMVGQVALALMDVLPSRMLSMDELRALAREAIKAMREPSAAMTGAASGALKRHIAELPADVRARSKERGGVVFVGPIEKHTVRWRAMIDAALAADRPAADRQ